MRFGLVETVETRLQLIVKELLQLLVHIFNLLSDFMMFEVTLVLFADIHFCALEGFHICVRKLIRCEFCFASCNSSGVHMMVLMHCIKSSQGIFGNQ